LVATTIRSRSAPSARPRMRSASPSLYALAVSKTRTPRSSARRTMRSLSAAGVRLPKFIVPSAMLGGWPAVLAGIVVMASLFLPRAAGAHTPGLSVAELTVAPGGRVDAHLTFATAEPLAGAAPRLAEADLRAFVLDGVDVFADGARCTPGWLGSSVTENDGLLLESTYDCPTGATSIAVTLYYLSALPRGHREVVRIVGPPGSNANVEAVLSGDRRALELKLPPPPPDVAAGARKERLGRRLTWLSAAFAAVMVSLFVWRWRAARRRSGRRTADRPKGTPD